MVNLEKSCQLTQHEWRTPLSVLPPIILDASFIATVVALKIFRHFCGILDAKIGACLQERKQRSYLGLLLNSAPVA